MQHIASGIGAYVGGLIVTQATGGELVHFGVVGWIAALATIATLWLAGRLRSAEQPAVYAEVSAEEICLAAAAEATADAGEPMLKRGRRRTDRDAIHQRSMSTNDWATACWSLKT